MLDAPPRTDADPAQPTAAKLAAAALDSASEDTSGSVTPPANDPGSDAPAAAALQVTRPGAADAMPALDEVIAFLDKAGP